MDQKKQTLSNIYVTLVQMRYPNITTATAENIEITILKGGNRISLLSWLLTEIDEKIAVELQKLKGSDLEDKLVQYYSKIGICNDKDVLLGNCILQEQLPTLNLLLDFMKLMHNCQNIVESSNDEDVKVESIDDVLQVLKSHVSSDKILSVIDPKLNYSNSLKYFDDIQKVLDEYQSSSSYSEDHKEQSMEEIESPLKEEKEVISENDRDAMFTSEIIKLLEAFSLDSLPVAKEKSINTLYSMNSDIQDVYSNFFSLTQFLRAKDEICNTTIPDGIEKITTPLNKVIEDILISAEAIMNIHVNHL
ncbi:uncharacterized protein LOC143365187 [Halictus rubicundus]|uniref:uncharacterized protein LOC143365187 n=1 Tax=Halictus rubicundus TaxID=77578 RepID=UPI004036CED1